MILSSTLVPASAYSSASISSTRASGDLTFLSSKANSIQAGVIYSPAAVSSPSKYVENVYSLESINAKAAQAAGINDSSEIGRDNSDSADAQLKDAAEKKVQALEQEQIKELAARDREVRAHEQAHAAVGGQYAGAPRYEFERGPDGVRYAVGGEVSIDVSKAATPEETLRKAQTVRRAAMAPAEPSAQDRAVAAQASRLEAEAIRELAVERIDSSEEASDESPPENDQAVSSDNEILPQPLLTDSSRRENSSISSYESIANINIEQFNRSRDQNSNPTSLSIESYI